MEYLPRFLLLGGLLGLSALFSGTETAFFSLTPLDLHRFRTAGGRLDRVVAALRSRSDALLVAILLGNMATNVLYYSTAAVVSVGLEKEGREWSAGLVSVLALVGLILFGEVLPKTAAFSMPRGFARLSALPAAAVTLLAGPASLLLRIGVSAFDRLVTLRIPKQPVITEEELRTLVELSLAEGTIDRDESRLLRESMDLFRLTARHIMVPRVDMVAASVDDPPEKLLQLARRSKVTKIPVYRRSRDRIVGVVKAKNVILYPDKDVASLVEPVLFVPETLTLAQLMRTLRESGRARAVVVDEYGGTEGLVTLEDIVEEVVGDIRDEYDPASPPVEDLGGGAYRLSGTASVRDWGPVLGEEVEQGRVETFSGFVTLKLGRLPRPGDEVLLPHLTLRVESVERRRAAVILLRRRTTSPGPAQAPPGGEAP